jgi:hypothetical protein
MSTKLVPTFADGGCRVVSATDPYGHILAFLDSTLYVLNVVAQMSNGTECGVMFLNLLCNHWEFSRKSHISLESPCSCLMFPAFLLRVFYLSVLSSFLYECETWSLTIREEHRLRVFENRVLRRIFGPKRDVVTGEWRKLHNDELRDLYSSQNIIRLISLDLGLVHPVALVFQQKSQINFLCSQLIVSLLYPKPHYIFRLYSHIQVCHVYKNAKRKLICDFCRLIKLKRIRWAGHVARMGEGGRREEERV